MSFTEHEPHSGSRFYEERWERADTRDVEGRKPLSVVGNLDGDWKVERLSGPVPMPFVWKRIRSGSGTTRVSPPLRRRRELRLKEDGSWLGRANAAGIRYAWFRMVPLESNINPASGIRDLG
jgi:hypothetical protein